MGRPRDGEVKKWGGQKMGWSKNGVVKKWGGQKMGWSKNGVVKKCRAKDEGRGWRAEDGGQRMEGRGWRAEDGAAFARTRIPARFDFLTSKFFDQSPGALPVDVVASGLKRSTTRADGMCAAAFGSG